jgi:signal recognition particle GTPase
MLVAADVYRPAAIDQLNILGKKVICVSFRFSRIYRTYH